MTRREYMREYMKVYRKRRRAAFNITPSMTFDNGNWWRTDKDGVHRVVSDDKLEETEHDTRS
jgi:hypothetical protein